MTDTSPQPSNKERVTTYLYFLSLYSTVVGVLYLWGYWSIFHVNILEYLSITDIIKTTIYPIVYILAFTMMGAIIGEVMASATIRSVGLPQGVWRHTRIGIFLHKWMPIFVVIYMNITILLILYAPIWKWRLLPILLGVPLGLFAKRQGFLQSVIPHDSPRTVVIYLLATLPILSYGQAVIKADNILRGAEFQYVVSPVGEVNLDAGDSPQQCLRFLSHAGDFIFFFEPNKSMVVVSKFDTLKVLLLKNFSR